MEARRLLGGSRLAAVAAACAALLLVAAGCGQDDDGDGLVVEGAPNQAWSPDSRELAVATSRGFSILGVDGKGFRQIQAPPGSGLVYPIGPTWTEDDRLLFISRRGPRRGGVWAMSIRPDGTGLRRVRLGLPVGSSDWSQDGRLVFASPSRLLPTAQGEARRSPNLWILDDLHSRPRLVAALPGGELYPEFSPDGRSILFNRPLHRTGLWTIRADGSGLRPVASEPVRGGGTWAPDGTQIAVVGHIGDGDTVTRLWLVPLGGGDPVLLADEPGVAGPAWTSDGRWIAYTVPDGRIRRVHPDGSGTETIAYYPGDEVYDLLWSPNGRHLALTHFEAPKED